MYFKDVRSVVLSVCVLGQLAFLVLESHAQSRLVAAVGNPRAASVVVGPSTNLQEPVYFYYVSKGNQTTVVEFGLEGPGGVSATVDAAKFTGAPAQAAATMRRPFAVELSRRLRVNATGALAVRRSGNYPGGCTQEQYELYLLLVESTPELSGITPEQYCENIGGGAPGGGGDPGGDDGRIGSGVSSLGLLRKDTCAGRKSRYLVRMKVDLSRVNPSTLGSGVTLKATFRERRYTGSRAASIKPVSDGMFAPSPLLMMSSLYSREAITQSRWSRAGKLQRKTPVRIENYVYYRGLSLTRSVVTNLLRQGGKATFDLSNGERAYSVCFKMQRIRQRVNGYPGDDGF